ncbi:MAG: exodeoxyribonuclease VII small subunit [Ignavibacteria bacterium]|nr:exodeoxyribonuclease VII small subunit [Ignavibacteria bacterium]
MKKKADSIENKDEPTFERSFKRLEEILNKLENEVEDYSLEEIIKNYQEGLQLLKICRAKLSEAELKIEKISTEEEV